MDQQGQPDHTSSISPTTSPILRHHSNTSRLFQFNSGNQFYDDCTASPTNDLSSQNPTILDLPPEIRHQVYIHLLPHRHTISLIKHFQSPRRKRTRTINPISPPPLPFPLHLSILSINKQIHIETSALLYSTNDFIFESAGVFNSFFTSISKEARRSVRSVILARSMDPTGISEEALVLFEEAVNLRCLRIGIGGSITCIYPPPERMPDPLEVVRKRIPRYLPLLKVIAKRRHEVEMRDILTTEHSVECSGRAADETDEGRACISSGKIPIKGEGGDESCGGAKCRERRECERIFWEEFSDLDLRYRDEDSDLS